MIKARNILMDLINAELDSCREIYDTDKSTSRFTSRHLHLATFAHRAHY